MTWFDWTLIVLWVVNALASIAMIGKEREPITHGVAMANCILAGLLIIGLVRVG